MCIYIYIHTEREREREMLVTNRVVYICATMVYVNYKCYYMLADIYIYIYMYIHTHAY